MVDEVALLDEVDLLGIALLSGGDVVDSAASREIISLPSASFSGVVPNLAVRKKLWLEIRFNPDHR